MMKTLLSAVLIAASLLSFGCKDDDDDPVNCNTWTTEIQDEFNELSAAAQAYASAMTTANCNAYKAAAQAYVDAVEDAENCAAQVGQQAQWQQALLDAQASVNAIQC
jgi:hypothetical protein